MSYDKFEHLHHWYLVSWHSGRGLSGHLEMAFKDPWGPGDRQHAEDLIRDDIERHGHSREDVIIINSVFAMQPRQQALAVPGDCQHLGENGRFCSQCGKPLISFCD